MLLKDKSTNQGRTYFTIKKRAQHSSLKMTEIYFIWRLSFKVEKIGAINRFYLLVGKWKRIKEDRGVWPVGSIRKD